VSFDEKTKSITVSGTGEKDAEFSIHSRRKKQVWQIERHSDRRREKRFIIT